MNIKLIEHHKLAQLKEVYINLIFIKLKSVSNNILDKLNFSVFYYEVEQF